MDEELTQPYFYFRDGLYYLYPNSRDFNLTYQLMPMDDFVEIKSKSDNLIYDYEVIDYKRVLVTIKASVSQPRTKKILPYGIYSLGYDKESEGCLKTIEFNADGYLDLQSELIIKIEKNISQFIRQKKLYEDLELLHKRGYLLYGAPGKFVWRL